MTERNTPNVRKNTNAVWGRVRTDLKQIAWKDPIVMILCAILIFLTFGSAFGACTGTLKNAVTVELDAAYGGGDTGYQGLVNEADVTENIVNDLEALLKKDRRFKVLRSHEAGTAATVAERAEKINKDNPLFVLSVHADGSPNAELSGMHVYAEIPSEKYHEASLRLAQAVADTFKSDDWTVDTGYLYFQPYEETGNYELKFVTSDDLTDYKLDTFALMKQCDMPVVVTNQFYVTNQADVDKWANDAGYQQAAQDLYDALCDYNGFERKNG